MTTPKKLVGAAAFSLALAAGGAAGALFGSPLTSGAQEPAATSESAAPAAHDHPRLAAAADALGISASDLAADLQAGKTIAAVAQERGIDVNTVIDALVADAQPKFRERITAAVNGDKAGRKQGQGQRQARRAAALGAVSDALGMTKAELRSALQGGETIASLATAHGVDPQTLIDTLVADATAKIDAKVASGDLDAARADQMKSHLVERITAAVNGQRRQQP
jgi:uncharacterized protein YidB (DUF937 family)